MELLPDQLATPYALRDLDGLGLSLTEHRRAVATGTVRRVLRGVYVASGVQDSVELRARALAVALPSKAIACDRSAGWLHGVDVLGHTEKAVLPHVEACVLRGQDPTELDGVCSRTRDLSTEDIVERGGLLVTSPLRTALDLGCILRRRDALAALDQFRRIHLIEQETLALGAARYFRRRGVVQLRQLIPLSDPRAESVRESWTRLAILDYGLPAPDVQVWVGDSVRLDLGYPRHRIAVEYDGEEFHDLSDAQRTHDRERREFLRQQGWLTIVVRRGDFTGANLDAWLERLRRALLDRPTNLRW